MNIWIEKQKEQQGERNALAYYALKAKEEREKETPKAEGEVSER